MEQEYTTFETKSGFVGLAWNQQGVSALRLPARTEKAAEAAVLRRLPGARRALPSPAMAQLISDIRRYFVGVRSDFSHVPGVRGSHVPVFSHGYAVGRNPGRGETTTYGTVAKTL